MPTPPNWQGVRCKLDYTDTDGTLAGSRFYLSYSGSAPSGANCNTLAADIASTWNTTLQQRINDTYALTEVDVLDLGSNTGASGTWTGSHSGFLTGTVPPSNCCGNVEFDIARRYRGGKPRMFVPGPSSAYQQDNAHWTSTYVSDMNTQMTAFMAALAALSIGSMGTLAHVAVSYYQGVDKNQPPAGTWRGPPHPYPPLYRTTPHVDPVTGYATKSIIGSQRRRLRASTY